MLDFVKIMTKVGNKVPGSKTEYYVDIYPEFIVKRSRDLMIKGGNFYAVWNKEKGLWSTSEDDVQELVDKMIVEYADQLKDVPHKKLMLLSNFSSNKWITWQKYCKSLPDNYHDLDTKVIFSNTKFGKTDYVSRKLDYSLEEANIDAYDQLMSTLYDPSERQKLEWAIGSIINGDSKDIQKFIVLYGASGTGKSTVLNIIQEMFPGYYSMFDSKAMGSSNSSFALESFRNNPLIAIEHDGDLSRIEDNTRINSVVAHEEIIINEKFKSIYSSRFHSFMFLGTNKPVKITDAKSGIIRRLIDVSPSGRRLPIYTYENLMARVKFELGGIAYHCLKVYENLGMTYYNSYIPISMIGATNDFYNFVEDNLDLLNTQSDEGVTLNEAWLRYKEYGEEANIQYLYTKRVFKDELKNYFNEFIPRTSKAYNIYRYFKTEKMDYKTLEERIGMSERINGPNKTEKWLKFDKTDSLIDILCADNPAQYALENGAPGIKWDDVKTKLKDLDTSKLHYVRLPLNHIVIDFDIKDENGNKDFEANLEAANMWPPTYAELSKSEAGIHLHYYYDGDPEELSRIYATDIEVKVFVGKSSLRRKLTKCNDLKIFTISSGLPTKGVKKVGVITEIKDEKHLRSLIKKGLNKQVHANTKPSMDYIHHILEEMYNSGKQYDVTDLRPAIQKFAMGSTNQAEYCMRLLSKMKFSSDEPEPGGRGHTYETDAPMVFFDVEVFPNLFVVCWKKQGKDCQTVKMINPMPSEIEELVGFKLVGFNNRRYDNHILYAKMMGYNNEQLFNLSQRIISGEKSAMFYNAYNISYTDVYDFLNSGNKMSLKKWEIKLDIFHKELDLPWDQPVDESRWEEVADYCVNDVVATEAVFDANQSDWIARQILVDLSGLTVNDTTNTCTTKIIVGNDKNPQQYFKYTDLSVIFPGYKFSKFGIDPTEYVADPLTGKPNIKKGKSIYRGEDPSEGGYVYSEPGIYENVYLLDLASMHPRSAIALDIFGKYTKNFEELVNARLLIKHKEYDKVRHMLGGKLAKYLNDERKIKDLSAGLKTAINSVYGLTSATFSNKLRDPRNDDNIVAKYGALFMINLKHEVQQRGYKVIHIKTDSIKIANGDDKIVDFCMEYAKRYGQEFEHEATFEKICLVNDAVYIAKYSKPVKDRGTNRDIWWTATGAQFQVPYVFKKLFSHEKIAFNDLRQTFSVSTALYLDMNEDLPQDEHDYHFIGKVGSFCPILPGHGGGVLLRQDKKDHSKFGAVQGTKKTFIKEGEPEVYYWLESEMVKLLEKEDSIDISYYEVLVDDAIKTISEFGDFKQFIA